jgi:peptidoglycan/LPS O-acetylase OafA/YrhL
VPLSVRIAAIVQLAEAAGVLAASLIAGVDAVTGKSYQRASGIAITLIGIATGLALAYVARGLNSSRRWSRTPAMLTQLFAGIVAIYLLQAPRLDWGIPAIVLAIAGLGALLAPASIRQLTPGRIEKS